MNPRKRKVSDEPSSSLSTNGKKRDVLIDENGLLKEPTKLLVERALDARTTDHLSYGEYAPETNACDDVCNGRSHKTPRGESGELPIEIPRSSRRLGAIAPSLTHKHHTCGESSDDKVLSSYPRGMTVREIQARLEDMYGAEVSPSRFPRLPKRSSTRSRLGNSVA